MVVVLWVRLARALCVLLLTWVSAHACCAAQQAAQDARATARSELSHFAYSANIAAGLSPSSSVQLQRRPHLQLEQDTRRTRPWLWAAAGTTAALAAGYAVLEGFSYRSSNDSARAFDRSRDFTLDYSTRAGAREQGGLAQQQAALLSRISDICLAGTVAATGATLLIWLTSKRKRQEKPMKTLIGPMVLRGAAGAGLVLREKF